MIPKHLQTHTHTYNLVMKNKNNQKITSNYYHLIGETGTECGEKKLGTEDGHRYRNKASRLNTGLSLTYFKVSPKCISFLNQCCLFVLFYLASFLRRRDVQMIIM